MSDNRAAGPQRHKKLGYSLFKERCVKCFRVNSSELHFDIWNNDDFHIWNANSQLFGRARSEAKMAAHVEKFCTSVSVLFAVLYVSSSPLHDFNIQFLFG